MRRSAFIKANPKRVWQEFETKDKLAAWFGTGHRLDTYEPKVGGQLELSIETGGARRPFGGKILVLDASKELSFESDWLSEGSSPSPTILTLRLTPFEGGTHVELIDHGYENCGENAGQLLEDYEAGWDNHHLMALRAIIER